MRVQLPEVSSYPLVDFAFKTDDEKEKRPLCSFDPFSGRCLEVKDAEVREAMAKLEVSIRKGSAAPLKVHSVPSPATKITLVPAGQVPNSRT
jgi:hypothetical protein